MFQHVPATGLLSELNGVLADLFRAHGIEPVFHGDWVVLPDYGISANAQVVVETEYPTGLTLQIDLRLRLSGGETLIESAVGWGENVDSAVKAALDKLISNSFHVLLTAFFGQPAGDQVEQFVKSIGGQSKRVTEGTVLIVGTLPRESSGNHDMRWFAELDARLRAKKLSPGTHWLRVYYAQNDGKEMAKEALLDNQTWTELEEDMRAINWPRASQFYSVRWFVVIQDLPETTPA